jgi:hypothetical protein
MNTHPITIDLPFDLLLALNETETELKQGIKTSLAMRLYRLQNLQLEKQLNYQDFQDLNLKHCSLRVRYQFQILQ